MSSRIYTINDFDELEDENSQLDDYMIALQIQMQMDENDSNLDKNSQQTIIQTYSKPNIQIDSSLNDPTWELIDPCPDIRAMFQEFDKLYFWNRLGSCIVEWSKRMTICAGIFYLRGGGIIRLSEPLLKYRPRKDLVDTLLHEMIHAYLYLTRNFKDRGEHGDEFKGHMNRINKQASTNITVYHSFHDEVNHARQHVWRCNGICRQSPPFYGYVKRSMNRAPGKNDTWWAQHQSKCNGTFEKVSEPEGFKKKLEETKLKKEKSILVKPKKELKEKSSQNDKKLESFFSKNSKLSDSQANLTHVISNKKRKIEEEENEIDDKRNRDLSNKTLDNYFKKKEINTSDIIVLDDNSNDNNDLIECPLCFMKFSSNIINSHVNNHF